MREPDGGRVLRELARHKRGSRLRSGQSGCSEVVDRYIPTRLPAECPDNRVIATSNTSRLKWRFSSSNFAQHGTACHNGPVVGQRSAEMRAIFFVATFAISSAAFGQLSGSGYVFNQVIPGIYTLDGAPGWGIAIDVQKGVLFWALYGYDSDRAAASSYDHSADFLTGISDKQTATQARNFEYAGSIFRTDAPGFLQQPSAENVGSFTMSLRKCNGQPCWDFAFESDIAACESPCTLRRFGYLDADPLSIASGAIFAFQVTNVDFIFDQAGGQVIFGNERLVVSGQTAIEVATLNPNTIGLFFLEESSQNYVLLLANRVSDLGIVATIPLATHNDHVGTMQATDADLNPTGLTGNYIATNFSVDASSAKAKLSQARFPSPAEAQELMYSFLKNQ